MSFYLFCQTCKQEAMPVIDKSSQVYCSGCNNLIPNVSHFTKVTIKSLGQIKTARAPRDTYAVKCASCNEASRPVIKNNKFFCGKCDMEMKNLTPQFKELLKNIKK